MSRMKKMIWVLPVSLVLALLVGVISYCSAPSYRIQVAPEDAVSVLEDLELRLEGSEILEDGTIHPYAFDSWVDIDGLDAKMRTVCVQLKEPITTAVRCQFYYWKDGEEVSGDNSEAYLSNSRQTTLFFHIKPGEYDHYRLDIDTDYTLVDFKISNQLPDEVEVDRYQLLKDGDFSDVNVKQMVYAAIIFIIEGCFLVWYWQKISQWFVKTIRSLKENRKKLAKCLLIVVGCAILAVIVYFILMKVNGISASHCVLIYLVCAACGVGGVIALYAYNPKREPAAYFFVLCICFGLALSIAFPASAAVSWDDQFHYEKAFCLSYAGDVHFTRSDQHICYVETVNVMDRTTEAHNRQVLNNDYEQGEVLSCISDVSFHLFPSYLAPGGAIWLMRALGTSFTTLFYAGRMASVLLYAFIVYFAMKRLGKSGMLIGLLALVPTAFFLTCNYSYDMWCIEFMMLGMAVFVDEYRHPERKLTWGTTALMLISFFLACLPKQIYFPILIVAFFMPKDKFRSKKHRMWYYIAVLGTAFVLFASFAMPFLVSRGASYTDSRGGSNVSAARQVLYILTHPFNYAYVLGRFLVTTYFNPDFLYNGTIIYFAYMLKKFALGIPLVLLILVVFIWNRPSEMNTLNQPTVPAKLSGVVGFLGAVVLTATSMYVAFNEIGSQTIGGCQERYILPILFAMLILLQPKARKAPKNYERYCFCVWVVEAVILLGGYWPLIAQYI